MKPSDTSDSTPRVPGTPALTELPEPSSRKTPLEVREQAFDDWMGGQTLVQLAEAYGLPLSTLKSWHQGSNVNPGWAERKAELHDFIRDHFSSKRQRELIEAQQAFTTTHQAVHMETLNTMRDKFLALLSPPEGEDPPPMPSAKDWKDFVYALDKLQAHGARAFGVGTDGSGPAPALAGYNVAVHAEPGSNVTIGPS